MGVSARAKSADIGSALNVKTNLVAELSVHCSSIWPAFTTIPKRLLGAAGTAGKLH